MPSAMSIVWDVVRYPKKSKSMADLLLKFDTVLGLDIDKKQEVKQDIPEEVLALAEERLKARANKDWDMSDKLRDKIQEKGYIIKDSKDGFQIEKA